MRRLMTTLGVTLALLATTLAAQAAPGDAGLNARMIRWQQQEAIVHIFVFDDSGTTGTPPAVVPAGKPLLFGYEWTGGALSLEELQDFIEDDLVTTVSIDGGPAIDLSGSYLEIFESDGTGPRWTWDHDHDGRGDRDGDGIPDFPPGYIAPFRWEHGGLSPGLHTFEFTLIVNGGFPLVDVVTFEVTP